MSIKEIVKPVEAHLNDFNKFFKKQMESNVPFLDLIIQYMTKKTGKQVRPAMVFLSAELCGNVNDRTYIGAALAELLHSATLVHDDVVDEATKRRGIASINSAWNNKIAVLIGDFLLAKGLLAAIDNNEFEFLKATSHAVRRMSEGELLQIQKSKEYDADEAIYFRIIADKTASLMAACCEIGAISATDDRDIQLKLREFGEMVGIAFQIQDDIFDYMSKSSTIGKPVGNDLKEKKLTLPLIYSFRQVSKNEAKGIVKIIKNDKLSKKDIKAIVNFVFVNGGIEYAQQKAKYFSEKAIEIISDFEDGAAKKSLINFSSFVINRES